ncbi:O-succinylhomoserine sulfhydrylase [Cohaesibacter sp. CAU 1516]|uniref:O-succinylhomoserine sulfhydrylase n=1 Tax=Cohaesibacter sp. CAU 1516 TaxID=2576038 RepID=UPI0010FD2EAF|nr:O-succinylhomoserine sulfhydrylase [Cohaesibacter sp. CAU 1516]TLP45948.1 O-succinylhomoserine sulfhydrylase [Cohaesibacter sp. CAU 1516]
MSETKKPSTLRPATEMVHGGVMRSQWGETSEALFMTQGYVYDSAESQEARFKGEEPGYVYSRYANPTISMFEERMALLEGAEAARGTASGMAAVTAAMLSCVKAGDHVVAASALFGSCLYIVSELLPRFGVECTLVDGTNLDAWKAAMQPNTRACFLESPTNPVLSVIDIAAVAAIAHEAGARLVVDNVFATALWQSPLALGADVVIYSATKHIDGQGRCLGGVVLSSEQFIEEELKDIHRHTGPSLSPFNAWVMLKGLETFPLRVKEQTRSAGLLADRLAGHKAIERIYYPGRDDHPQAELCKRQMRGGSTMVAIDVAGGKGKAFALENALKVIKISNNLGDAKSLITHPATTTHQRLDDDQLAAAGIGQGTLRLSVGLEDVEDLWDDFEQALARL